MIVASIDDVDSFIKDFLKKIEQDLIYPLSINQTFFFNKTKKNTAVYELSSVTALKKFSQEMHTLQEEDACLFKEIVEYINAKDSAIGINFFKQLFREAVSSIDKNAFQQSYVYLQLLKASIQYFPVNLDYKTDIGETALHHLAYVVCAIADQHECKHAESLDLRDRCANECLDRLAICHEIFQALSHKRVFHDDLSKDRLLDILTDHTWAFNHEDNSAVEILLDINQSYLRTFFYEEGSSWHSDRFFIIDALLGRHSYLTLEHIYRKQVDLISRDKDISCTYHHRIALEKFEFFKSRLSSPFVQEQRKKHVSNRMDSLETKLKARESRLFDENVLGLILRYAGLDAGKIEWDFEEVLKMDDELNNTIRQSL